MAALILLVIIPIQLIVYIVSPPPSTANGWLTLFQNNKFLGPRLYNRLLFILGGKMGFNVSKQRLYASLLILGASILLFRTIKMISQGSLDVLVLWVSVLLITELLIDLSCLLSSIFWWINNDKNKARIPLRLGATAAILHAVRVLIFVLGRVGPWKDFDVRPEHKALHYTRWSWGWLYFAAILSVLGVIGVMIIWTLRRRAKRNKIDNL